MELVFIQAHTAYSVFDLCWIQFNLYTVDATVLELEFATDCLPPADEFITDRKETL
jgi:hypothetical protein